jgi:hypothetical protein
MSDNVWLDSDDVVQLFSCDPSRALTDDLAGRKLARLISLLVATGGSDMTQDGGAISGVSPPARLPPS